MCAYKRQLASFKRKDKYFDETSKPFQFVEKKISLHFSSLFYSKSLYSDLSTNDKMTANRILDLKSRVDEQKKFFVISMNSTNVDVYNRNKV